jgi:predicted  nucleic acid-binding Zn-ribbon protein
LEQSCFEAATTSTVAALRRSEVEEELEWVVAELISAKMNLADAATAVDVEKRKVFNCKHRLQAYAERVTSLELTLASVKAEAIRNTLTSSAQGSGSFVSAGSTGSSL